MTEYASKPEFWSRWREKRWFRWTVDILFFVGIFALVMTFQTWNHVDRGEPSPQFALSTLDGQSVDSQSLRGKPTVLFFWAPWCGVCEADAHNIADLHEALGDQINVISVALSYETVESVEAFVEEHGVVGPVLMGNRGTSRDFEIDSFPTIYILDEEGQVASSVVGYTTEIGLRFRLALLGII